MDEAAQTPPSASITSAAPAAAIAPTATPDGTPSPDAPRQRAPRKGGRREGGPRDAKPRRNTILLVGLLLLGLLLTLLFALRTVRSFRHFQEDRRRPPGEAVDAIAPWMTVEWVGAAYDVPPGYIYAQLGIPAEGNERRPLAALERFYRDGPRGVLLEEVRAALHAYYAGRALPTPVLPEPGSAPMPDFPFPGMGRGDPSGAEPASDPPAGEPPALPPAAGALP